MLRRFRKRWSRVVALLVVFTFSLGYLPAWGQDLPRMPLDREAPNEAPQPVARGQRLISLNFRDAPLDQVLNFYAELTGRTLIKSPGINATITLRGQTRLMEAEAMIAIESVLAMHNVVLVPMGEKFFKVVQPAAARTEGMPMEMVLPEEPFPETDKLISQMIDLKHIEISEAQPIVQSLMHGYGKLQVLERTNSLLITDTASNLRRIMEILEYIDRPVTTRVETRIYELRYAEASKVAGRLSELIADAQAKEQKPRVAPPSQAPKGPPGVIRPRRTTPQQPAQLQAAELAERGIIRGKVKLVADDRTNILIVISEPTNFIFFDKIVAVLDRPVEPEIIVRVMALEYADAEEISGILNEFIGAATSEARQPGAAAAEGEEGGTRRSEALREYVVRRAEERIREAIGEEKARIGQLSSATKILADKRTNSLLLMGRKSDVAALEDIISKLDVMLPQVLIEAVILEVGLTDEIGTGVQWLQRSMTVYNEELLGPRGGIRTRQPVFAFGGSSGAGPFLDGSQILRDADGSTEGFGAGLTYYATFFDLNIDMVIQMVQRTGNARILQTPVILTTDNTEAKIVVGEERPVVTSTSVTDGGTQTSAYEYRNIGINLTVTPRINPQGFVVMEIAQTADDFLETVSIDDNEVPVIIKRELQAEIAVKSRTTIVLGGLVSTRKTKSASKIPLLGNIPLLGVLFRSSEKSLSRRELLVLITPYVLMTPEEAEGETERLYGHSRVRETEWHKGWSESPLATTSPEDLKAQKKAEKLEKRKQAAEARADRRRQKLELRMKLQVPEKTATGEPFPAPAETDEDLKPVEEPAEPTGYAPPPAAPPEVFEEMDPVPAIRSMPLPE